jgi:hypothetical protein
VMVNYGHMLKIQLVVVSRMNLLFPRIISKKRKERFVF